MKRREFIKNGCLLCIGSSLMIPFLESCQKIPVYKTKSQNRKLKIPLSEFKENYYLIVKPVDIKYDVAVIKKGDNEFLSLMMKCTHADNPVQFNGTNFQCILHGSIFDKSGNVERGPAEKSLFSLTTELVNNELIVTLK